MNKVELKFECECEEININGIKWRVLKINLTEDAYKYDILEFHMNSYETNVSTNENENLVVVSNYRGGK